MAAVAAAPLAAKIAPWVAIGLQSLGTFFSVLGRQDEKQDLIDPDIKDQFESVKRFRQGQHDVMKGAVTGAIDFGDVGKGGGISGIREKLKMTAQVMKGREAAGSPEQAIADRVQRRDERLATAPKQDFEDIREAIAKKRGQG